MREIFSRRFARKNDSEFARKFPDLIVIDGGKGQLSAVMSAVKEFEKNDGFPPSFDSDLQIISLAKQEEEVFRVGSSEPVILPRESAALKLLQRIRDESHRFAITFNRAVREKKTFQSALDLPGIGSATKKKLLQQFETVSGIRSASDEDLRKVVSEEQFQILRKNL